MAETTETITELEVLERFKNAVREHGGQRAFAQKHHFSPSYINDIMFQRRKISETILPTLGVERVVTVEYRVTPTTPRKEG